MLAKGVVAMGGAFGEKRGNRTPSGEVSIIETYFEHEILLLNL